MLFENITTQIKDIEKNKIDFAREIYLKEIKLNNRPDYYERLIFKNFIEWFDNKIISTLDENYSSYILVKDTEKIEKIKKLYPNSKVISLSRIVPLKEKGLISEYIRIEDYNTSLFRLLYRHMHNDKENFKIKEDNYKKGYIIFKINPLTDGISNFRNRHSNKKYVRVNNRVNSILNKIEELCEKYKEYEETGVLIEDINTNESINCNKQTKTETNKKYKVYEETGVLIKDANTDENIDYKFFINEQTKAEIELYTRFIEELDFFVLSRDIIYNTDKLCVLKNNEDRNNTKITDMPKITIEDILEVSIKDANISSILNIEKYIYPCWRIACDHFYNQRINYHVIGDSDKYIKIKSFL